MSENAEPHLWEIDHPYYCTEGNFYRAGQHEEHETWTDFLEQWGGMDEDLNLVFRWDWFRADPEDYKYEKEADPDFEMPGDVLQLYYMMQRKARNMSVYVKVVEADETAVREFLTAKAEHMRKLWAPLLGGAE